MSSFTEMAQMALGHIGTGKTISDVDTEESEEARALRTFKEVALKRTMRAVPWSFLTKIADMELVEEDPNDEWAYSYRVPSDCLLFRKVQSGIRNESRQSRAPFRIASDSSGQLIFTDMEDGIGEYTAYVDDPTIYPPDFVMAFTYYWAFLVAARLTKGDPFKLGQRCYQLYEIEIANAIANMMNEQQPDELPDSEFIRSRE